ncbi:hypothetical protein [Facklamia hominis]|uniref:Uncharacterized protein n=1 Tax=Facklamia hominis CCUG 36813 TaxID=883111 RepID=K1LIL0_9LACT|nr:hypothetical protein [Facklamia hominis]EKB54486.1 hypothetical protein HMPREF9706_00676 [Facklamia hominis CCUG 36813]
MNKKELINAIVELIEDNFPDLIKKEKAPFDDGDTYYCIGSSGGINNDSWDDHQIDKERLSFGNIFKTREEAEFMVEKLKVIHELEMLGRPFKYCRNNCYIALDADDGDILFYNNYNHQSKYCNCYFDNEEEAKIAIEKIGRKRIKKYLFGVEEE